MANEIEKVNSIAIASIAKFNGKTDDNMQKINGAEFTGSVSYRSHQFTSNGTFSVTTGGSVDVLVVAGGGGGGQSSSSSPNNRPSGGGGGGGLRTGTFTVADSTNYTIVVGAGGAEDSDGGLSEIQAIDSGSDFAASGGGAGGAGQINSSHTTSVTAGHAGGSGGGGGMHSWYSAGNSGSAGAGNAGSYSPVEGYAGGQGTIQSNDVSYEATGGGGGAGGVATEQHSGYGTGRGGVGVKNNYINGEQTSADQEVYGAGGSGYIDGPARYDGVLVNDGGARGSGGATNASGRGGFKHSSPTATASSGTTGLANLGGGGGGGDAGTGAPAGSAGGAAGASGVVIIRYIDSAVDASGGTEATYSI